MARIRSIKPELASDKTLAGCSIPARYTFVLLISQADDYGLLMAEPRQLLGQLYPHDEVSVQTLEKWLAELCTSGRFRFRTTKDGARVIELVNWKKHQLVKNPGKPLLRSRLLPVENRISGNPPEDVVSSDGGSGGADRERDLGEGEGKGEGSYTREQVARAFETAWALYPKRPGNSKANARRAFESSIRSRRATPEQLIAGVEAYAGYVVREAIEPRYIKRAETFFGPGQHWESDYGPAPSRTVNLYDENGEPTPEIVAMFGLQR